jgi:two-component system, response regulator
MREHARILLVDDDLVDCEAVVRAFKTHKVMNPIFVVHDGVEALQFLRREGAFADASAPPTPSLVLMDLEMPRMNGLECLTEIKNDPDLCHIPVIIFTSSVKEEDVVASYKHGAASFIPKPVTFEKMLDTIRTLDLYWTLSELP